MATLDFNAGVDLTGLTDFEADYSGRLYADGVNMDGSAVTVTILPSDSTIATLGNLPAAAGSTYAVTLVVSGLPAVVYYPETSFFGWRVIPYRVTGETAVSLSLGLVEDGAASASILTVAEGVAGGGDYLVSGWPQTAARWTLTWVAGGFATAQGWTVDAPATPINHNLDASTAKRLAVHEKLKAEGFPATFEIATIVDREVASRDASVTAYALDLGTKKSQTTSGKIEDRRVYLTAALQADGATLLDLDPNHDRIIVGGRRIAIEDTGRLRPANTTILYELEVSSAALGGA